MNIKPCPCHSGKPYSACCEPYHRGDLPDNALALMRSRFSAYALKLTDYIIQTTSPQKLKESKDLKKWKAEILFFCENTIFENLEILEFIPPNEQEKKAFVTFKAHLKQNDIDVSFTEKSRFEKIDGKWFYLDGKVSPSQSNSN